ncbi:glucose-6-phosphate 1-dehydrogenase [Streptomyces ambofaciens]
MTALHRAGLPPGTRIVLEKPFGENLSDAQELNRLLSELVPERAVFRVDHFLAMTTVQNVLGSRLANRMLEPIWNSTHIAEIEIVWDETLALEGRAGYYDQVGALKDMVQNHLLQLLCLVAMEPPLTLGERDLRDRKVDVLRSVRPLTDYDVVQRTRRARYSGGRAADHEVPAYADEAGVDPQRRTETFAEIVLELDSWRWAGTRFRLRSGKALGRNRMEVAVRFRSVPHLPFGQDQDVRPNVLRFGLEPESLSMDLTATGSRPETLTQLSLTARMDAPDLPAYGRLCCWTSSRAIPPCPSAATRPRRRGASSSRSCPPGRGGWFRWRSTRSARTDHRRAMPRPNGGTTCCTRKRSCRPTEGRLQRRACGGAGGGAAP